jgi:hypothetical protein
LKKNFSSVLKILFFLAIGVFFIWLFLRQLSPEQKSEIWHSFITANYSWVFLSIIIGILSHVVRAYRWRILMEPMGYHPKISNTLFAVMIGYLANMALPRLGEVTRCGVLNKYEKIPINNAIGTVIIERSIDMLVFILLFFINLFIFFDELNHYVDSKVYKPLVERLNISNEAYFYLYLFLFFFVAIFGFFFLIRKRISHLKIYQKTKEVITGFWNGLWSVTKIKKPLLFIFQSLFIWVLYYAMIYVCVFSLPETSQLGPDAVLSMLIFGSIGIIVVQGGIGIYPAIIAETLVLYGIVNTYGYALGWLTWTAQTLMILVAGVLSLILLPIYNKKTDEKA